MTLYNIPSEIKTLIFDIDGTLYTSPEYVAEQIDVQIRHWSKLNGWTADEGRRKISEFRKDYAQKNNGKKISLGNAFTHFEIDIETSIEWRNFLLEPSKFLSPNLSLKEALKKASESRNLICLTNNPVDAARKTLEAVGISEELPHIIGLDTCYKSKPDMAMMKKVAEITKTDYKNCVSIGDRYDIDLSLPVELGMGGVLVSGAEEVVEFLQSIEHL